MQELRADSALCESLESQIKEYLIETGEIFPDHDSARVLSEALDEETLSKIDDAIILKLTSTSW